MSDFTPRWVAERLPGVAEGDTVSVPIVENEDGFSYSLLNGSMPPGLTLQSGSILGVVGNVPGTESTDFQFTVRASNGILMADRRFVMAVMPVQSTPVWRTDLLPPAEDHLGIGVAYHLIASLEMGDAIGYGIGVTDDDGVVPTITIGRVEGISNIPVIYNGYPPPGVTFDGARFEGMVPADARPGTHLMALAAEDAAPLIVGIEVLQSAALRFDPPIVLQWRTAPGDLGGIVEMEPVTFAVEAADTAGNAVTYSLVNGALPPGVSLDPITGQFRGAARGIDRETVYPFAVRASSGATFEDREFATTVRPRFVGTQVYTVFFRLPRPQRTEFRRYAGMIGDDELFRPGDTNFGLYHDPACYLIGGLAGDIAEALDRDQAAVDAGNYHTNAVLRYGRHVGVNVAGVYDVVFRALHDPQDAAGGHSRATDQASEERVVYAAENATARHVYPSSLRNRRYDLARRIGFATDDDTLRHLMANGIEWVPPWMAGSYVAGIAIAAVRAGLGDTIAARLDAMADLPVPGTFVTFERYYVRTVARDAAGATLDKTYKLHEHRR